MRKAYGLVFFGLILSYIIYSASSSSSADMAFSVEFGSKKHVFVFQDAVEEGSASSGSMASSVNQCKHSIQLTGEKLKESDIAFAPIIAGIRRSMFVVCDTGGKAKEISADIEKFFSPLLNQFLARPFCFPFSKLFQKGFKEIRNRLKKTDSPVSAQFCAAGIMLDHQWYWSFTSSVEKTTIPFLLMLDGDIITFDFGRGRDATVSSRHSDPLVEYLRVKSQYTPWLREYAQNPSKCSDDEFNIGILHTAGFHSDTQTAEKILEKPLFREYINFISKEKRVALAYACSSGCASMVKLLCANGADQCIADNDGSLPLHKAIENYGLESSAAGRLCEDWFTLVQTLLTAPRAFEAVTYSNCKGDTPIALAEQRLKQFTQDCKVHTELFSLTEQMKKMQDAV